MRSVSISRSHAKTWYVPAVGRSTLLGVSIGPSPLTPLILRGRVQPGKGDASRWLGLFNDAYVRKTGMPIFPGSLAVWPSLGVTRVRAKGRSLAGKSGFSRCVSDDARGPRLLQYLS